MSHTSNRSRRRPAPALVCHTVEIPSLSAVDRQHMFELMERCYDGVDRQRFESDLDDKAAVLLLRDPVERKLRGFSTIRLATEELEGRKVDLLFSGDTVIEPAFWGTKALHQGFSRYCLVHRLKHPWRPLYWLLLSKGFKTYLLMVNHFRTAFPRRGPAPNPALVDLRDRVARAWWGQAYDAQRGILSFGGARDRVRSDLVGIDAQARSHPDVEFFLNRNPGFEHGDELVCLAALTVGDLARALFVSTWRAGRRALGRRSTSKPLAPATDAVRSAPRGAS